MNRWFEHLRYYGEKSAYIPERSSFSGLWKTQAYEW